MSNTSKQLLEMLRATTTTPPRMRAYTYGPEQELQEHVLTEVGQLVDLKDRSAVIWVNIDGPCGNEILAAFGAMFKLHPLALEDVANTDQRAKVEEYPNHYFVVSRMVSLKDHKLETEQLSVFLGKNFLLTFQEKPGGDCLDPVRERLRRSQGRIRELGADHLAYAIMDAVIDGYFPILEDIEEELEELEEKLDGNDKQPPSPRLVRKAHAVRRKIQKLRHAVMPSREVVHKLSMNTRSIQEETRLHLRDCYDHVLRILEMLETHRDTCLGIRELYQTRVGNHLNEVMKILAIITTIFTPLTFIAGIYGMNFNPDKSPLNMPELNWFYGYPFALAVMGAVFLGMLFYLYRRGWLTRAATRDEEDDEDKRRRQK
ncbi:MAG: magnesium/cobalt transporter CorA [Candidatus Obscuribacterales bacterium]|nr:magnesium/cobalt transporter CorA [Candidatus Obscuribacterales bacterium]